MATIPRREDTLARPRYRKGGNRPPVTHGQAMPATIPPADPDWHPIALRLYESIGESGQSCYFQSTDWAVAYMLCEEVSAYKNTPGKRSSMMLSSILSGMNNLLLTEGDRRKARIELDLPDESAGQADLKAIDGYKARLKKQA